MVLNVRFQPSLWVAASALLAYAPAAFCDIYQWTDEKGGVVYSNIRPKDASKLRTFKVVMQEVPEPARSSARADADIAAREAALAAQAEALREQELRERVASLEQELAALRYSSAPGDSYSYPAYGASYPYSYSYAAPYTVVLPRVVSPRLRPFVPRSVPSHPHAGALRPGGGRRR